MDADILQAIRIIDDKIASLQEARDRLASAFGITFNTPRPATNGTRDLFASADRSEIAASNRATATHLDQVLNGHTPQPALSGGRKVQLAQFLSEHGPMSRVTIVEQCGIPEGTVSYCLNDKRFFEQNAKGDWDITDYSRKGLDRRTKTGSFQAEEH